MSSRRLRRIRLGPQPASMIADGPGLRPDLRLGEACGRTGRKNACPWRLLPDDAQTVSRTECGERLGEWG